MAVTRISRCLQLFEMLLSNWGFTVRQLAEEFGVSTRTVFRDLRVLEDSGIPVWFDHRRGGHVIGPFVRTRFSSLSEDELPLLLLAALTSPLANDKACGRVVRQSVYKVASQFSIRENDEISALLKSFVIEGRSRVPPPSQMTVFLQIIKGLRHNQCLRIAYDRPGEVESLEQTKLSPYRLMCSEQAWSVMGRSSLHRRTCSFDIQLIHKAELIDEIYERPPKYRRSAS